MTPTNLSFLIPVNKYKEHYQRRLLVIISLFWLLNGFLSWLYLCQIGSQCSPTRLVSSYISGVFFWYLVIPFAAKMFPRVRNSPAAFSKKILIFFWWGALLMLCNQLFVFKIVELSYSVLWSYSDSQSSWIREIITNNIILNIFFYCMIVHITWLKTRTTEKNAQQFEGLQTKESGLLQDCIIVKDGSVVHRVNISAIKFIKVEQNCTHIHTYTRKYIVYKSLLKFSEDLSPEIFVRIHRSVIVNQTKIKQICNLPSGDAEVTLECGTILKCSRNYKSNLRGQYI